MTFTAYPTFTLIFLDSYHSQVAQGRFTRRFLPDPAQEQAAQHLQEVFEYLTRHSRAKALVQARLGFKPRHSSSQTGLWLWGGVGSGKTSLMDLFYESLPLRKKRRLHFHRLMYYVHMKLKQCGDMGEPLNHIAADLASDYKVICLDEFFVIDIADAMILHGLMEGLCKRGVTLVATSNTHPDRLYEGGLQRERFLPTIELIKTHLKVFELVTESDYRLKRLEDAETYCLIDDDSASPMELIFQQMASDFVRSNTEIDVQDRKIPVCRLSHDVIWFDFEALCGAQRSVDDYIVISRCFTSVLLSGVPVFDQDSDNAARRFIHMVDEFYDRSVKLILSAHAEPDELYQGERLKKEFERTASRLHEMRTRNYQARPHLTH